VSLDIGDQKKDRVRAQINAGKTVGFSLRIHARPARSCALR
jgi:hypothetical protein